MTQTLKTVIAVIMVAIVILLASYHGSQFRKNHLLTVGSVVQWDGGNGTRGNFGPLFYYQYYADGKILTDSRRNNDLRSDIGRVMTGRSFPVAYKKYWYGYEENILITPRDFELYGHPFPDSLKWILQYVNNE